MKIVFSLLSVITLQVPYDYKQWSKVHTKGKMQDRENAEIQISGTSGLNVQGIKLIFILSLDNDYCELL